jgi:hypothetical protein
MHTLLRCYNCELPSNIALGIERRGTRGTWPWVSGCLDTEPQPVCADCWRRLQADHPQRLLAKRGMTSVLR